LKIRIEVGERKREEGTGIKEEGRREPGICPNLSIGLLWRICQIMGLTGIMNLAFELILKSYNPENLNSDK